MNETLTNLFKKKKSIKKSFRQDIQNIIKNTFYELAPDFLEKNKIEQQKYFLNQKKHFKRGKNGV